MSDAKKKSTSLTESHAMQTAIQISMQAEITALVAFCHKLAEALDIPEIDGVPVGDWLEQARIRERQRLLEGIENTDPSMAARLQALSDEEEAEN